MTAETTKNHNLQFVEYAIKRMSSDKGLAANVKRSESQSSEYMIWDFLAGFNINLEFEDRRIPYALVSVAIAHDKAERNGTMKLGQALVSCYPDGKDSKPAIARLRRLLSCNDLREVSYVLRQILSLVRSRCTQQLDYALLLGQLRRFPHDPDQVKAHWAQQFYAYSKDEVIA